MFINKICIKTKLKNYFIFREWFNLADLRLRHLPKTYLKLKNPYFEINIDKNIIF